jgi:phosphatidylglycerol:prolipoprotein diacylglycerol transferase
LNPVLGVIAGYPVYVFPLLLNAGIVAGLAQALYLARRRGLDAAGYLDVVIWVVPSALIGSRLAYAVANWGEYAANPLTVFSLWEGGLSLLGAVTVGAAVAWWALGAQRLPQGQSRGVGLDSAAVGLALGQAIGRLGCLAAGCATGVELPPGAGWPALPLPDATGLVASRFPSQVVESLADLLLWGFLLWLWARRLRPGAVAVAYLIGYGTLRFLAEPLRENVPAFGPLTWGQAWGALAVGIGVVVLVRWTRPGRERPGTEGAPPPPEYAGDA